MLQEPEPCDAQARYETPQKKVSAPDEESTVLSPVTATTTTPPVSREPKKEAKIKAEPEEKKEIDEEEGDVEEEAAPKEQEAVVAVKPKGQRGRKRKSVVIAAAAATASQPSEVKTEVKEEKLDLLPMPAAPDKAELDIKTDDVEPVLVASKTTEVKKVGKMFCFFSICCMVF